MLVPGWKPTGTRSRSCLKYPSLSVSTKNVVFMRSAVRVENWHSFIGSLIYSDLPYKRFTRPQYSEIHTHSHLLTAYVSLPHHTHTHTEVSWAGLTQFRTSAEVYLAWSFSGDSVKHCVEQATTGQMHRRGNLRRDEEWSRCAVCIKCLFLLSANQMFCHFSLIIWT